MKKVTGRDNQASELPDERLISLYEPVNLSVTFTRWSHMRSVIIC